MAPAHFQSLRLKPAWWEPLCFENGECVLEFNGSRASHTPAPEASIPSGHTLDRQDAVALTVYSTFSHVTEGETEVWALA